MTQRQQTVLNQALSGVSMTVQAQIGNGVDQVLSGAWTTACLKSCKAWERISTGQRQEVSRLVDLWLFNQSGHSGCTTEKGIRAYFKPEHNQSTPILETKLML